MQITLRHATLDDVPALATVIEEAVMVLQAADYTDDQRRGALGAVFGVDTQLIKDGTYLVAEAPGVIVGCGGWSRRKTLFGGDGFSGRVDEELDPARDAARIRAFFVKPGYERRGIGRRILEACEAAAVGAGFQEFELASTLTGIALYSAEGYEPHERHEVPLPNGLTLPVVRMTKRIEQAI
jgi:GNAT superfamily N-acetyltransferase